MPDWNPALYLKFERERTQPVRDLVARIEQPEPARLLDIGCGPGNSTAVLKNRWPGAKAVGLDKSPAMIERARQSSSAIEWREMDAAGDLSSLGTFDVALANASLQWLPDHRRLLPRLMQLVADGGALAVQIPQFDLMPSAHAIAETSRSPDYAEFFANFDDELHRLDEREYYDALSGCSRTVELWVTHYYHVLENHAAIVDWVKSTAMRPYLERLPVDLHPRFSNDVLEKVKRVYPLQADGRVLFIFKRLFFIAYR